MTDQKTIQDLATAYIYAVPLVIMEATFERRRNVITHGNTLVTDKDRHVVRPGVDFVFSNIRMDLLTSPMVLSVPGSKSTKYPQGTYCTYQIADAYTNSPNLLGTGFIGGNDPGEYLIAGPGYKGKTPHGMYRIDVPTNMAWICVRHLCNGEEDLPKIRQRQQQIQLTPLLEDVYVQRVFPDFPAKKDIPVNMFRSLGLGEYFNLYNRLALENPPYPYDMPLLTELAQYGIGPGKWFDINRFGDISGLESKVLALADAQLKSRARSVRTVINNWSYSAPHMANFGADYHYRAFIAIHGLMANPAEMAVYLTASKDSEGQPLSGQNRYRLHFDKGVLPPVKQFGFWSLTAYGSDDFLIPNKYDRFRIGSAQNARPNPDGSLTCYIQNDAPGDQSLFDNFLPCGDGPFDLAFRIYLPEAEVLDYSWKPPAIEKI